MTDKFPGWRYGPGGKAAIFESEADVPNGWEDHPTKVKGAEKAPADTGTKTAVAPSNSSTTAEQAAKTTTAKSQTTVDPLVAAKSGIPDLTAPSSTAQPPAVPASGKEDVDAAGTAFDPALHAATKSKTKAGLWRMKVGVARPAPKPPLDL